MVQQVKRRFATRGLSGNVAWRRKWRQDGRAILTGRTGALLSSWFWFLHGDRSVGVASAVKYAKVHQLGTRGKGGKLPPIRPKRAKALFIPLMRSQGKVGKDFIFLKKVDIAPRPMLPESDKEKTEQADFLGDL